MPAWTTISNALVAVGAKPFATTIQALRDNPEAIAEGATGAPVVAAGWHPYNKVNVGDANDGKYYDVAINGAAVGITSPTFQGGYDYLLLWENVSFTGSGSFNINGTALTVALSAGASYSGSLEILMPTKANYPKLGFYQFRDAGVGITAGILAPGGAMGFWAFSNFGAALTSVTFGPDAGSHDGGRYYLYRRRNYVTG